MVQFEIFDRKGIALIGEVSLIPCLTSGVRLPVYLQSDVSNPISITVSVLRESIQSIERSDVYLLIILPRFEEKVSVHAHGRLLSQSDCLT